MIKYMIAYHAKTLDDGKVNITDSNNNAITSDSPDELWDFLYHPYRDRNSRELKFFWDLDESLSNIFRLMPPEKAKKLLTTKFNDVTHVYYRRGKNLIIKGEHPIGDNKYMACIYGLNSLIKTDKEPQNAQEALTEGQRLLKALNNIGITTPMTLNSAIGIYESAMRNIQLTPDIKCIPTEAVDILNYAKHCANRQGWITAYKISHFPNALTYDVSGSYAFHLSRIRDFNHTEYTPYSEEFIKDAKNRDDILKGNITGFFKVGLTISDNIKVHPFAYVGQSGLPIYPTGAFETYLTLEEILYFKHYKVGSIKIIDGWFVKFTTYINPMENIVNRLFKMRQLGDIENDLCKGILVGYVGKMNAQFDGDTTSKTYNPMIAGWIYAQARLQVFKFIMENDLKDDVIAVSTDGVMCLKEATKTSINGSKKLGTWRLNEPCPALVLSPGWIIYKDKKPHSITYDIAMKMLKENPKINHYRVTLSKRVTLFEAIEIHHDISMVGKVTDHHQTIDLAEIEMSQDRIFKTFPHSGKALLSNKIYESEPIKV